jgi:hypothetical protein
MGGPDDCIAWARDNAGIAINVPRALAKLAHKAISEAFKVLRFSFFESQVAEKTPRCHANPS